MTQFTARDLDRQCASVLKACDEEGEVKITHRDGRSYRLVKEDPEAKKPIKVPDFAARKKAMGFTEPIGKKDSDAIDRLIAGEYPDKSK